MTPYKHNMGQRIKSDVQFVNLDMGFIAHLNIIAAAAVGQDLVSVLAAKALTAEAQEFIAGITNPAVPRSLRIKGNAVGIAGNVVVTGTNYADEIISETIALNGDVAVEGTKAFKTVTKVELPVQTHEGTDTVSVGLGNKLGLPYELAHNTVLAACRNNVRETTAPTVTVSATELESNTVLLNSALNSTAVDIYLIV